MVLGALVDAGLDIDRLRGELAKLGLEQLELKSERTERHAIAGTHVKVHIRGEAITDESEHHLELPSTSTAHGDSYTHSHGDSHTHSHSDSHTHSHGDSHAHSHGDSHAHSHGDSHAHSHSDSHAHSHGDSHAHHHLADILTLIRNSSLDQSVRETSCTIFERLAAAESTVHGSPPEKVHLHEVGALDAVADIVGAVAGLHLLGVEKVFSSPLSFGTGFVRCAHGRYPVPVPGVLALCQGIPSIQTDIRSELVTPTGAALITTLASQFGPAPVFSQTAVGYGAGSRDLSEVPNMLRVRFGEMSTISAREELVHIEANIDDMNPEIYGYLFELLLERGARDVYVCPIFMKKGRPGHLLGVLTDAAHREVLAETILAETTTLGVRYHSVERRILERYQRQVETPFGPVGVKIGQLNGRLRAAPEYEDCARLAREHQVPILSVYEAASAAASEE
jgi:pyridinium-3,5-bisthiocarboxylic acid mononucleotide nickel chelatase